MQIRCTQDCFSFLFFFFCRFGFWRAEKKGVFFHFRSENKMVFYIKIDVNDHFVEDKNTHFEKLALNSVLLFDRITHLPNTLIDIEIIH